MAGYRVYFLDVQGRITAREEFQAETDEYALVEARALYAERARQLGFELWRTDKIVHKEPSALPQIG